MRVEFATPASSEFLAAIEFFESEGAELGSDFVADVEHATGLLAGFPDIGGPGPRNTRRLHLRRFPFAVVYRRTPELIWVIAIEHHRREPGYWRGRL